METKNSIVNNEIDEIPDYFEDWYKKYKNKIIPSIFDKNIMYDCKNTI